MALTKEVKDENQRKFYELDFYYPGTLIYFDKNLNVLEDIDYLEEFNWESYVYN